MHHAPIALLAISAVHDEPGRKAGTMSLAEFVRVKLAPSSSNGGPGSHQVNERGIRRRSEKTDFLLARSIIPL